MKRDIFRYEIEIGGEWFVCQKAVETGKGWLHYQMRDGTNGMKRPGTWRVKLTKPFAQAKGISQ